MAAKAGAGAWAAAPVRLVVAQVRFERHTDVASSEFVGRFRSKLTDEFSSIEQASVTQVTAGPHGIVPEQPMNGWVFGSDRGAKIVVLEGSAALEVTKYVDWESFMADLDVLLGALEKVVHPATEQRLGLRYVDELVTPEGIAARWKGYVRDELLGPVRHDVLGDEIAAIEQRVMFKYRDGSVGLLRHGFSTEDGADGRYVLDTDVSRTVKGIYDEESVRGAYADFHAKAHEVFLGCLTPDYESRLRTGS